MALLFGTTRGAGSRRNIHQLTPIMIINYHLSASSIYYDSILPVQFMCLTVFLQRSLQSLWATSWSDTFHFILHTFLHAIIVFFFCNTCHTNNWWKLEAIQRWLAICHMWPWTTTHQKFLLCISGQGLYSHQKLNKNIYWFSSESGYRRRRRRQRQTPVQPLGRHIANY